MKLRIDFDSEQEGEYITLEADNVTIDIGNIRLEPAEIIDGHIAIYDAPDDLDMSELDAALDVFPWSFNGYSVEYDTPTMDGQ